jgi:hypothetical protein
LSTSSGEFLDFSELRPYDSLSGSPQTMRFCPDR